MIYLFTGDDAGAKHASYEKFLKSLPRGTEIFSISRNNFDRAQIESLYSGRGLFFTSSAALFSNILDSSENRDFILEHLGDMGESENAFVFLEGKLGKPITDLFKKARAEINVFELGRERKERFDNFLLANAFSQKDKFNLWIYFRKAIDAGASLEELVGILFWKMKDMILKRNFNKFSEEELKNSASRLSFLLPQARRQGRDAESALEQFLLEVF